MSGSRAVLDALNGKKSVKRTLKQLPEGAVSYVMNTPIMSRARVRMDDDYAIHVSDVMRSGKDEQFCPRQMVLEYIEQRASNVRLMTPGRDLMFATAHMFHSHVVDNFVKRSNLRKYVYGRWSCLCGKRTHVGYMPEARVANVCKSCNRPMRNYHEYALHWANYRIVGHPDLLFLVDKRLYIYEIKTLDRRDVDIRTIRAPLAEHMLQASFYYYMARAEGFRVDPHVRYLYVDRSSRSIFEMSPYKEFKAAPSSLNGLAPYLAKATAVKEGINTLKLPNRVCESSSCKRAEICPVRVSCFSRVSNNAKKILATE